MRKDHHLSTWPIFLVVFSTNRRGTGKISKLDHVRRSLTAGAAGASKRGRPAGPATAARARRKRRM